FEAGFEVRNLLEVGRAAPTLGAVLETQNRRPLAWLRLLWSLRPRRPWDHCGKAVTVFEVAHSPGQSRLLEEHPDLLLLQEGVAEVYRWQSPSVAATLRARESVACPECRHAVLTRLGKIGRSLEEPAEAAGERAGE